MFKTEYVHAVEGLFIIFIGFITMSCAFQLTNSGAEAGGKIVMCLCEAGGFSFLSFSLSVSSAGSSLVVGRVRKDFTPSTTTYADTRVG